MTGMGIATAIAIGIMVIVVHIRTAATTNAILPATDSAAAVRARCHRCHIGGPVGSVVVDDDVAPMAAATTKTLDGTAAATATATATVMAATAMATATEEEECNRCNGANP
jgi:hypothetical protein